MTNVLIAYLAGVVTILSPCILPLLPIVLGGALSSHKYGPYALATGLVLAFTGFGLLVATAGFAIGLTPKVLNQIAAVLMIGLGAILLSASLQQRFAVAASVATGGLQTRVSAGADTYECLLRARFLRDRLFAQGWLIGRKCRPHNLNAARWPDAGGRGEPHTKPLSPAPHHLTGCFQAIEFDDQLK